MAIDNRQKMREFIDELKLRVDMAGALSPYVKLKKNGRNYKGLCPFHSEKTPSFHVHPDKNYYHCFGCGEHGDVIKFLQLQKYGGDFMLTVKELAKEHGMKVPSSNRDGDINRERHNVLEKVADFYRRQLRENPEAVKYLADRGVSERMIKLFEIGFAPKKNSMAALAKKSDVRGDMMLELGVVRRAENRNNIYDTFRDRIIFPIRNEYGMMTGFGGRTIVGGDTAKYLNSPQSRLFDKSRLLYGIHQALPEIRQSRRALVVEGYTDVVALTEHGVGFAVAPMGTAATPKHMEVLFRYADKIVFCFDGDEAGRRAARKAMENVLGQLKDGKGVMFMFLSGGEDPDSYVRQRGAEAFLSEMESAIPLGQYLVEVMEGDFPSVSDESDKVAYLKEVTGLIERIDRDKAPFLRETIYQSLAKRMGMEVQSLQTAAGAARRQEERNLYSKEMIRFSDGKLLRLLSCLNNRPQLVHRITDMPILGEPRELELFQESCHWLVTQEDPEPNALVTYLDEVGQHRLARQLRKDFRFQRSDIDPENEFEVIAGMFKSKSQKRQTGGKIREDLKRALESTKH